MDSVLLKLQIQIGVGEATGATISPGLAANSATDLATPCAVFETLSQPCRLLDGRDVLPGFVVARTVSMMHRVEDPKLRLSRGVQGPPAYEERSCSPPRLPECEARACRPRR